MLTKLEMNLARRENLGDGIRRTSNRYPDKTALIFYDLNNAVEACTYKELNQKVNRVANSLLKMGLSKGDRVAVLSRNSAKMVILSCALFKLGAWFTPVNFMLSQQEVKSLIDFAEPKFFFVEDLFEEKVKEVAGSMKSVEHFGYLGGPGTATPGGWIDFNKLLKGGDDEPEVLVENEDEAALFFTSGTESAPKGVMSTHNSFFASQLSYQMIFHMSHEDFFLLSLPMIHMAGFDLLFLSLTAGATVVMTQLPKPSQILELLDKHKITSTALPPTIYVALLSEPGVEDCCFDSAKKFLTWSSTIPKAMVDGWKKIAPNLSFFTGQGSSESSATVITGGWFTNWDNIPNHDGRWVGTQGLYGVELKLVDETGKEVAVGEPGEQLIRGPALMKGYYKNDEANNKSFRDGWFYTGDVLFRDEAGNYFFADRKKDMIKTGGENVFCQEVESVIGTHPEVMQCAVFGMQDDRWGEAVTAAVVRKLNSEVTQEDIITFCKEKIAGFKVPKRIYFRLSLPMSAANKILKRELRVEYTKELT